MIYLSSVLSRDVWISRIRVDRYRLVRTLQEWVEEKEDSR
jgi:hypothetical protein